MRYVGSTAPPGLQLKIGLQYFAPPFQTGHLDLGDCRPFGLLGTVHFSPRETAVPEGLNDANRRECVSVFTLVRANRRKREEARPGRVNIESARTGHTLRFQYAGLGRPGCAKRLRQGIYGQPWIVAPRRALWRLSRQ